MTYLDIYKIFSFQNKLVNIHQNAIDFCKSVQESNYCVKRDNNKRFENQKLKIKNLIEKIYYLFNDTKIIFPKLLRNFTEKNLESEEKTIANTFQWEKNKTHLYKHTLMKAIIEFGTTLDTISVYNFWIQDFPDLKNSKTTQMTEWLDDILEMFNFYFSTLQQISELLTYAKNGLWHPEFFDPTTFNSYQQTLKRNFIDFELSEIIKYSKIQYFIYQHQLIFLLSTPNIGRNNFQIYKIHPLSIDHNLPISPKPTIFLKPEMQYVGISDDKQNYFILDNCNLNSCNNIKRNIICNYIPPLLNINKNPTCETSLLMGSPSNFCNYIINFQNHLTLVPLRSHYGWLYSSSSLQQIKLECPKEPNIMFSLLNNGILQINPECQISNFLLFSKSKNFNNFSTNIVTPSFKILLGTIAPYLSQI